MSQNILHVMAGGMSQSVAYILLNREPLVAHQMFFLRCNAVLPTVATPRVLRFCCTNTIVRFRQYSDDRKRLSVPRTKKTSIRRAPSTIRQAEPDLGTQLQAYDPCTTISTCERYDLSKATAQFYSQGMRSASVLLPGEMVHVKYPHVAGRTADVLVLSNGTVVAWGMTEIEVNEQLVPLLKPSEVNSYKILESEDMDFLENPEEPTPSTMIGDVMYVNGSDEIKRLLHKAAFSSGLARNTKLAALELSMDRYIETIKEIGEKLATGASLGMKGSEALKITGQLLQIRGRLNLYSELIETPDLYWSEPELEALYTLISKKLDVAPRIAILNKKLDYASEMVSILKSHTSEEASTRLEYMIILLIAVEVCFEIVHFAERYVFDTKPSNEH